MMTPRESQGEDNAIQGIHEQVGRIGKGVV